MKKELSNVNDLCKKIKDDMKFETEVKGVNFNNKVSIEDIINSYKTTGYQGSNLHQAIEIIDEMKGSKIFLGCTSNLISSGLRDVIRFIVEHKYVHVCVITAGGIEEDIIKTLGPTYCAKFTLKGKDLRDNGLNRIGNLVIPSENYEIFESWFKTVVDKLVENYSPEKPLIITPSKFIKYLGDKIKDKNSILYWCSRNNIPVYSPALTDGSIGDLFTFYKKRDHIKLDLIEDIHLMNYESVGSHKNGAIILGCGLVKHHILNANLFNNGLDYCVLVNTASEYDGSDSGANTEESISWGKIKANSRCVKVVCDATIIFPLMVYSTFYKYKHNN